MHPVQLPVPVSALAPDYSVSAPVSASVTRSRPPGLGPGTGPGTAPGHPPASLDRSDPPC